MLVSLENGWLYPLVLVVDEAGRFRIYAQDERAHKLIEVTDKLKQQFSEPH